MASETNRDEHERLKKRTAELSNDHDNLSLDRVPFNQADHDQHNADLRKHSADLRQHREQLNRPKK